MQLKNVSKYARRDRGETQLGVILYVIGFGVLCSILFTLQSCIMNHKNAKVENRRKQYLEKFKPKKVRKFKGYKVTID